MMQQRLGILFQLFQIIPLPYIVMNLEGSYVILREKISYTQAYLAQNEEANKYPFEQYKCLEKLKHNRYSLKISRLGDKNKWKTSKIVDETKPIRMYLVCEN